MLRQNNYLLVLYLRCWSAAHTHCFARDIVTPPSKCKKISDAHRPRAAWRAVACAVFWSRRCELRNDGTRSENRQGSSGDFPKSPILNSFFFCQMDSETQPMHCSASLEHHRMGNLSPPAPLPARPTHTDRSCFVTGLPLMSGRFGPALVTFASGIRNRRATGRLTAIHLRETCTSRPGKNSSGAATPARLRPAAGKEEGRSFPDCSGFQEIRCQPEPGKPIHFTATYCEKRQLQIAQNRLIAVPPFRANSSRLATEGSAWTTSRA